MKIADNVEMLELNGMDGAIYPTLIWDDERLVLVDAGFPGQTGAIIQAIAAAGFSAGRVTHVILTHQDIDHVGCVPEILKLSPNARVLAHAEEAPYIDGHKMPVKLAALLEIYDSLSAAQKSWCDTLKTGFANRRIPVSQTLLDGELLPLCGGIEVVHTPGLHAGAHLPVLTGQRRHGGRRRAEHRGRADDRPQPAAHL